MQVDFSTVLTDLSGRPLTEDGTPASPPATLRAVAITALLAQHPNEQPTAVEKVERFRLANTIFAAPDSVTLTAEQVTLIKRLIGAMYPPLIVGQAFDLLDPTS